MLACKFKIKAYLDSVQRRSSLCTLLQNVAPSSSNHYIDCLKRVLCTLYLYKELWFHYSWGGHKEGAVTCPSCCRNNLPTSSIKNLGRDLSFNYAEFNISYRLVTQRAFPGCPLKPLYDSLAARLKQLFVYLRR